MITIQEIVQQTRDLAAKYPDNVYLHWNRDDCLYHEGNCTNGTVGCIFGQILVPHFPDKNLDSCNTIVYSIDALLVFLEISTNDNEYPLRNWCLQVQSLQDTGKMWHECIAFADLKLKDSK